MPTSRAIPETSTNMKERISNLACLVFVVLFLWSTYSFSATEVHVHQEQNLQALLDQAEPYSLFILSAGIYEGNFLLKKTVSLKGEPGAVIDAQGRHDGIRVRAKNVHIESLIIRNWGDDLTAMNAGIFVEQDSDNTSIINNDMQGDTTGIWIDKNSGAKIIDNRIQGNNEIRITDRGNGIHLSNATNAEVRGNEVWQTRDGIYIISSQNNILTENTLHDLRYGVHYMYSHSNTVSKNIAKHTRAGYALMQSRQLKINDNSTIDSEDYGILLNFITYSQLENNYINGVRQSEARNVDGADGKGFFIYNSVGNTLRNNDVANAEIGIHLTAGSEGNTISGNSFIHNQTQVKYVATRTQEWSENGHGNYWSNYMGWDMNNDNIGDNAFEPNDSVDKLIWMFPQTKILMDSPAVWLLRAIQRQFPVLKSPGVRDSFPLMNPLVN